MKIWLVIVLTTFLTACGYDIAIKYENTPTISYRLKMVTDSKEQASETLIHAFEKEGINLLFVSDVGGVAIFADNDKVSRTAITLDYEPGFRRVVVGIYSSRYLSSSKKDIEEFERRKEIVSKLKTVFENSESFDVHPAMYWETSE